MMYRLLQGCRPFLTSREPKVAKPSMRGPSSALTFGPFASLVTAMTLTGANVPAGKAIALEMPVLIFLTVRFTIATMALLAVARRGDYERLALIDRRGWTTIAILAIVGSVLFTFFLIEGTKRTTAVEAGIITATLPAVVAVIAIVLLGQRLSLGAGTCIALSVAGLAVLQVAGGERGKHRRRTCAGRPLDRQRSCHGRGAE